MGSEPEDLQRRFGQNIWLDGLRRALVSSGELARWIERGVSGVIGDLDHFGAALAGAGDYDDDIRRMVAESSSVAEILVELVVLDARSAADVLRPTFDASGERDGFVSVDLPTAPADDRAELVAEGIRLSRAIGRDNVMLRLPATVEGCEALSELAARGITTAVGPIFGPAQHQRASAAHLAGLELRAGRGEPQSAGASIACIELGAVEAAVARKFRERAPSAPGSGRDPARRAAAALARRVLADRREIDASARARTLSEGGARPQRIAWSLIAPETVTIASLSTPSAEPLAAGDPDAGIHQLRELGIELDELAEELLDVAVAARASGIERLLTMIEARREALLEHAPERQRISLGAATKPVTAALATLVERDTARRSWRADATQGMRAHEADLESFARTAYRAGFRKALVIGRAGSVSAAQVLASVYGKTPGFLELAVLDSAHPESIRRLERWADPEKTLYVIASKSGQTLETECLERYFFAQARAALGDRAGQRFVAITDGETPLAARARERRYARTFSNPADVSGQNSALSFFGLVPAALSGADLHALLDDAARMAAASAPFVPAEDNPGVRLGAFIGALAATGRDKLTLIASPEVQALGVWLEQLLSELVVPIDGEPIGAPESYAKDRAFAYLRFGPRQSTDLDRDVDALIAAGFPVARIGLLAKHDLGGEFFRWQVASAIAAALHEAPATHDHALSSESATAALLEEHVRTGSFGYTPSVAPGDPRIAELVRQAEVGDHVALVPHLDRTPERDQLLAGVRTAIRDRLGVATTLRRGELREPKGIFLVITADGEDLAIPGKAHGFAALDRARAVADVRALAARGRRVLHVHLAEAADAGLTTLCRQLAAL